MTSFIGANELVSHLRITDGENIAVLAQFAAAACDVVEEWCGPISPREVTEIVSAPYGVAVLRYPLSELVSVPSGAVGDYEVDGPAGLIRSTSSFTGSVTYTAGFDKPPAWAVTAATIIAEHLWRTRRGGAGTRRAGEVSEVPGAGYLVPNQAAALMEPHRLVGIA